MREFFGKISHILAIVVVAFAFFGIDSRAAVAACNANEISIGSNCYPVKFSVTTTSGTTEFKFSIAAKGRFYVNWGDGTTQTLSQTSASSQQYSHTYSTAGSYTIYFGGGATEYNENGYTGSIEFTSASSIASISGSLADLFPVVTSGTRLVPSFYTTFADAINLTSIPSGLFGNLNPGADGTHMFEYTFQNCTGLTSIPADLFKNITTGATEMFVGTFYNCTGLTSLPDGLFSSVTTGASNMFGYTFSGCTGLTSIPGDLFENITTGATYMFAGTFHNCTGLTTLPDGLFSSVTTGAGSMFYDTFQGCTGLTSLPDGLFSSVTTGATEMFSGTFQDCTGLTALPENLFSGLTTAAGYMFSYTFYKCSNLAGYIPASTFTGLVNAGHPTASSMFSATFNSTRLITSCPVGTKQYMTGYESSWSSRVSCEPVTCAAGETAVGGTIGCARFPFSITTTSDTTSFAFDLSAKGTFYIDWGDGSALQVINRANNTSGTTYSHTYSTAGSYTIRIGGTPTEYNSSYSMAAIRFGAGSSLTPTKIASVSGSLADLFPTVSTGDRLNPSFYTTFYGATNLTSIPADLFSGLTTTVDDTYMFSQTFQNCTGLTSIPADLFKNITTGADGMFSGTFYGCTGLTSLPNGLFSHVTTGASNMFQNTFYGCTGLTALPENLFSGLTTVGNSMFYSTFINCSNLSGYIPPSTFTGLVNAGAPTASNLWGYNSSNNTFYNTQLVTICPIGTKQYFTGYESGWSGKVSCEPVTCAAGDFAVGGVNGCITPKFSVTTTSDTTAFRFYLGVSGYVDWGDGETSLNTSGSLSHTYATAGSYIIRIAASVPSTYNSNATINFYYSGNGTPDKIASVSGSLGELFPALQSGSYPYPKFQDTFRGATHLTQIPSTLFSGVTGAQGAMFASTFYGCTGLTSLPEGLFEDITAGTTDMFSNTFQNCTGLTSLPDDLFENITTGAYRMFGSTFYGCTGLTSLPDGLFSGITTGANYMFSGTFYGCTGLTALPENLFSGLTTVGSFMFSQTFYNCSNLAGYIPSSTFTGLVNAGSPTAKYLWNNTFYNTQLLTSCPADMHQYITGYEGTNASTTWNGRVSCAPGCAAGLVLYDGRCREMCSAASTFRAGNYSYPMFADKTGVSSPILHFKRGNNVCYVFMEPDVGGEHGLKFLYNNSVYHAVDPR